jgi:ribosome-interacting GTPase 1
LNSMALMYHSDRITNKCKVITDDQSSIEDIIDSLKENGFYLEGIVTFQPKYFLFGKREYTMHFKYEPTVEVFERHLQNAIEREDYRMAVVYRNKIKEMLG